MLETSLDVASNHATWQDNMLMILCVLSVVFGHKSKVFIKIMESMQEVVRTHVNKLVANPKIKSLSAA